MHVASFFVFDVVVPVVIAALFAVIVLEGVVLNMPYCLRW